MRFIGRLPFGDEVVIEVRLDLTITVWLLMHFPFISDILRPVIAHLSW
jgi:hypothetical protein